MKNLLWLGALLLLAGCATPGGKNTTAEAIQREMDQATQTSAQSADAVNKALLPPLSAEMPKIENKPLETRFDLTVNNTPASQVFMAIVSGTRYSMLLHPDISGNVSLNLKDVTVFEALEAIHEIYGYDYKADGTRIYIQPLTLQTRIFQVNYLTGTREGKSSLRVNSGSVSDNTNQAAGTTATAARINDQNRGNNSSEVTMKSSANFWDELTQSLQAIVGNEKGGRSVVISPMSGVIVVRAMPDELKNVASYLKASQISVERQVILEAKIVEVQLSDSFQSGVNWAAFKRGQVVAGQTSTVGGGNSLIAGIANNAKKIPNAVPSPGAVTVPNPIDSAWVTAQQAANTTAYNAGLAEATRMANGASTSAMGGLLGEKISGMPGGMFGMALQIGNFAALLDFLETQGNVHVLSSPRIATLNNQKAVLKVGTDEFFVTEISGGTQATANVAGTAPTVKTQPFFSGIALDVTPRIDKNNEIILHVHPSVSSVTTINKVLDLGVGVGTYNLPMASSSVSETDSIVRVRDGQIVAIGGLMRSATFDDQSGLPGLPKSVFGQTNKRNEKRELVILLKPTVVDSDKDWSEDITRSRDRFNGMQGSAAKQ